MKSAFRFVLVGVLSLALVGCVQNDLSVFESARTRADSIPSVVPRTDVLNSSSRLLAKYDGTKIFIAKGSHVPMRGICLVLTSGSVDWVMGCSRGTALGVSSQDISVSFDAAGIDSKQVPRGWKRLSRDLIVRDLNP